MAENETLTVDGRTASRWRPLREQISSGRSPSECFSEVERQFYLALRSASGLWVKRGVSQELLLVTAFERPQDLEALVRQVCYQDHASLLLDVVRSQALISLEQLVAAWLGAVWDTVRDLLQLDLCGHTADAGFDARVRAMLQRLARLTARNPARIPNRPRRSIDQPPDDLDDTLGRSILC